MVSKYTRHGDGVQKLVTPLLLCQEDKVRHAGIKVSEKQLHFV